MPVIRSSSRDKSLATLKEHLTELLFKELMGESTRKGPVVFEDPVEPDAIDVTVVWEAFQGLSPDDRVSIIREAYTRHSQTLESSVHYIDPTKKPDSPMVPKVRMAIGATWKDVLEFNLLPFSIRPTPPGSAYIDGDEVERLMIESGGIETPSGIQLRFPNFRMASEVLAKLNEEFPEAQWSLIEEVGSVDDWSGR